MGNDSLESYIRSADIFVGRDKEIAEGLNLINQPRPRPVLNVVGRGGIGKTKLISKIREQVQLQDITSSELIDFYDTKNQTEIGLFSTLAHSLGVDAFSEFMIALSDYDSAPPAERFGLYRRAITVFLDSYRRLAEEKPIYLFFDTFDTTFAESEVGAYFVSALLPLFRTTDSCIVVAGRQRIEHPGLLGGIQLLQPNAFTLFEAKDFTIQKYQYLKVPFTLSDEVLEKIVQLSEGRPILIALTIDWILLGHRAQEIIDIEASEYESTLVSWIRELRNPEDQAILYMAVLYRRFDQDLLAKLLELTADVTQQVFERIARFSFIKYRPQSKSCVLHDEMRDMVNKYIGLDPQTARRARETAAGYYENKILETHDAQERNTFISESIHNYYLIEPDLGFSKFNDQFELALSTVNTQLCRGLVDEISNFQLTDRQALIISLLKAELLLAEYQPKASSTLLDGLQSAFSDDIAMLARILYDKGRAFQLQGEMFQATDHIAQSREIYRQLEDELNLKKVSSTLGEVYFWAGQYVKAAPFLEEVLALSAKSKDERAVINALSTLGNVRRRQGQHGVALSLCEEAVARAKQQNYVLEYAHALRNLANIKRDKLVYDEAVALYQESLGIFRQLNDRLGIARTLSEYAWCLYLRTELKESRAIAIESIELKRRYNFNNELAATYHTLFEITLKEQGAAASYEIIEQVYDLAKRYHDGFHLFDALHHLVLLDFELQNPEALIRQRVDEMERYAAQGYQFLMFQGRATNILGHLALEKGDYMGAFKYFSRGYKMIAQQGGTATGIPVHQLFQKELKPFRDKVTDRSDPDKQKLCSEICEWWIAEGLDKEYPELLSICE